MQSSEIHCLHEAVQVLYAIWDQMVIPPQPHWGSQEESLTLIFTRTRTRCRRVLEHLFRAHPLEVIEAVVECWYCGQTVSIRNSPNRHPHSHGSSPTILPPSN